MVPFLVMGEQTHIPLITCCRIVHFLTSSPNRKVTRLSLMVVLLEIFNMHLDSKDIIHSMYCPEGNSFVFPGVLMFP